MIKVEDVLPIDSIGPIPIASIRNEYFKIVGFMRNAETLNDAIKNGRLNGYKLKSRNKSCLRFIVSNYRKIILGTPRSLEALIKAFDHNRWNQDLFVNGKSTPFGKALLKAFGYSERFRSRQSRGIWLASKLNVKVCPYCNSQYTLVVSSSNGKALAKFQFDHFFPLERFPYLSLSLFNLIPSCANCNHKKSTQLLSLKKSYHPYHNSIDEIAKFKVIYPPNYRLLSFPNLINMDLSHIKVDLVSRYRETESIVKYYDALYDISYIYRRHTDIAHTILVSSILYNKYYQASTFGIKKLFPDKETMLKYILGTYVETGNILKKPLSKFTQDIARQLGLL